MSSYKNEFFCIHRTTLLVTAIATMFGSFSVYKALGIGRTERSEVRAVTAPVSGTALLAGEYVTVANTNPLASATRLTNVPRPALNTTLTPIEQIQVGDRVLAESPTGEEDTAFGSEIIPFDWRKLTLRAPKRDGTVAEVVLLRPLTWLNEQHGEVGGTVFISVPECGIDGNAHVLAIDPCPAIPSGAGRVVTGTFLHQALSTITLTIAGQSEPIECTGNHPFWSEDRQTFVRADSLQPHETLRTATGLTTVESWTSDLNPTPVYNIEVHGAHVYHVGTSGVLVHNGNGSPLPDLPGVYIIFDEISAYVGSAGIGAGGMASRLRDPSHPARDLLDSANRTVMFLEIDLSSVVNPSDRNNILRAFEQRELLKMESLGYHMLNVAPIQSIDKASYASGLIEQYGISPSQRARLSCF